MNIFSFTAHFGSEDCRLHFKNSVIRKGLSASDAGRPLLVTENKWRL